MRALRLPVLVLLLALAWQAWAQPSYCSNYKNCRSCRIDDQCGWCAISNQCVAGTATGASSGACSGSSCWVYKGGNQCPDICTGKDNCADCAATQGCGWCGATKSCVAATSGGASPCSGNCVSNDETSCWKVGPNVTMCPSVADCSAIHACGDCTTAGCAWCPASSTCFEATISGKICPAQPLSACYGLDCIRDSPAQCPRKNCTQQTNCRDCASAGCDWCGLTGHCMEGSSDPATSAPCGPFAWCGNAGATECYKANPAQCPTVAKCEDQLDCKSCTTSGCFWCGKSRICMEASNASSPRPCRQGSDYQCGGFTPGDCWKGDPEECPSAPCENFTNCSSCTNAKCYWCGKTAQCLEASAEPNPRPCRTDQSLGCQTNQDAQCWKGATAQCPTQRCDDLGDCKTCAAAGCTWCGANGKCMETTATTPEAPCGYNWDACGSLSATDCWKSEAAACPAANCPAITNCTACTEAGCSWCADTQKCRETAVGVTPAQLCTPADGCLSSTCWKTDDGTCPHFKNGSTLFCDQFDGSCQQCVQNGCGYCSTGKKCLELSLSGTAQCEGVTQSSSKCPPARWNVGTCDADCASRDSTCSCLDQPGCALCAGLPVSIGGQDTLVTRCIAVDSKSKPAGNQTCMKLYTDARKCPNCFKRLGAGADCTTCLSSDDCGWCPGYCVYGDAEESYQQDFCPESGPYKGDIGDASGCKSCPVASTGQVCNAPYGSCNTTTGTCQCLGSRTGAKCDILCDPGCNHGTCQLIDGRPQCVCDEGWTSHSSKPCSVYCNPSACSGHGECNSDGTCTCDPDYFGQDCSKFCSSADTCSSHGHCDEDAACVCDPGNFGPQCTCSKRNCLNGGLCSATGACICATNYFGPTCAVKCDPAVTCKGHGNCSLAGCGCFPGWSGPDCSTRLCWAADDCADCSSNPDCGWCERSNACLRRDTISNCPLLDKCTASVSMLSYAACTDGTHCDCTACETPEGWRSLHADATGKPLGTISCQRVQHQCNADTTAPPPVVPELDEASVILIGLLFLAVIIGGVAAFVLYRRMRRPQPYNGVPMDEMASELKLLGEEIAQEEMITPPNVQGPVMQEATEEEAAEIEIKPTPADTANDD